MSTNLNVEVPIDALQKQIAKRFSRYIWEKPKNTNECINIQKGTRITLNNTQKFVSEYVTPDRQNGILLWHSVGSGKTLSAVAILKSFEQKGYNTLFITRTTLKGDLQKAIDMLPLQNKLLVLSYKQFSNIGKNKGETYKKLITRAKKINPQTNDPLYKTIIVIDEVHKLYTKDLKPQEMHDISSIERMIYTSYTSDKPCKVVLMSATPITSNPLEVINLFNLIIKSKVNRFDVNTFKQNYLDKTGKFTKSGKEAFQDRIKDLVSYIDMSKDPRKFAQVEFSEILVPISSITLQSLQLCKEAEKLCVEELGLSKKECKEEYNTCKDKYMKNKKMLKEGKFQTKVLEDKCKIRV